MIRRLIQLSPLTVVLFLVVGSPGASDKQPHFLLRAVDGLTSMLPTAGPNNLSNCALVMPDGRFYISLRRQEIMDGTATVKDLEGSLNATSLQILRDVLNQQTIRDAPKFDLPIRRLGPMNFKSLKPRLTGGPFSSEWATSSGKEGVRTIQI